MVVRNAKWVAFAAISTLLLQSAPTLAAGDGILQLLPACPGDSVKVRDREDSDFKSLEEGLLTSILSPLIGRTISVGLDRVGARLKEASAEKKVASLEVGGYLYRRQGDGFALDPGCLVIATRSVVADKKNGLSELTAGYRYSTTFVTKETDAQEMIFGAGQQCEAGLGGCPLATHLSSAGFSDRSKPGVLAILDIELSNERSEFRFVPRFIAIDHSVRERKRDSKPRDITFELAMLLAGEPKPAAQTLLKFENINTSRPFVLNVDAANHADPRMVGLWMSLPQPSAAAAQRLQQVRDQLGRTRVNANTANLAAATILRRTGAKPPEFQSIQTPCKTKLNSYYASFLAAKADLAVLQGAATKAKPLKDAIALATNKAAYYSACNDIISARAVLRKIQAEGFVDGHQSRAINMTVDIKEFRKRPVIAFLADVLDDASTKKAVGDALTAAIDPEARKTAAEEKAAKYLAGLEELEAARVSAEDAIVKYETASDDQKAKLFISMESAKRSANRKAESLGVELPYPESGLWL